MERRRSALEALNLRIHNGYDFNADPDNITLMVGKVFADQQVPSQTAK